MIERSGPTRRELVSIQDLAVELGVSIRTLRRWNKLPGAPSASNRAGASCTGAPTCSTGSSGALAA